MRRPKALPGHLVFGSERQEFLAWLVAVPMGKVTATYRIGSEVHECTGMGYHDHNWVNRAYCDMAHLIDHWHWGRGRVGPYSLVIVPLNLTYDALMVAFALGVWGSDEKRALRLTAVLVAGNAVLGALALLFFPWHPDEPTRAPANAMNVAVMASSMVCFLLAMAFGAAAFRNWFRLYSIGTPAAYGVLTIVGIALGSRDGERASVGIQERTMVLGYLLWVVVLASALLRANGVSGVVRRY